VALAGSSRIRFPVGSFESFTQSFQPLNGPGVDLASKINEHQGYLLGLKAAGA